MVMSDTTTVTVKEVFENSHDYLTSGIRLRYFLNDGVIKAWYTITNVQYRKDKYVIWAKNSPVYFRVDGDTQLVVEYT